jgi:hypothetical protein
MLHHILAVNAISSWSAHRMLGIVAVSHVLALTHSHIGQARSGFVTHFL